MLIVVCAACAIAVVTMIRLYGMKREIKRVTHQLQSYTKGSTEKKIDIALFDQDLETLTEEINKLLTLIVEANALRRRTENELKQGIANISHDLRTPLTSILGYIQLMESEGAGEAEKLEYLMTAKNRTKRLQELLHDFFDLSVIDHADFELDLEKVDMNTLVSEVLLGFYDRFNERALEPLIQLPNEKILLYTDESAIKRVVENLLANAATHAVGPVRIRLEKQDSTVIFSVSNHARHLNQQDVEKLFDRFYTSDATRSGRGTGLGLSIAKTLMLKMNGKLTAELQEELLIMKCEWNLDEGRE
ncbi:sensor histidine kinase [Brevibacillus brevis]|uniref:sensor histidine kinase n=1 Tax=Brevibacillus brevis TaxID=1393 RepID=UPI000D10DD33|nr:HAMP domain-containing sensor histidine kinase [Brevibacillus brevis]PSJ68082.1 two-component sensor histidine kinase [Brevibacillus brevis]RED35560.1 phospho-acceptor domain-containing protein [Brevibacillus brevis]GEC87767.1 two-component sensor histidine kinase [Brevibacillus brevis]VEF89329.1 Sensor histidine kinase YycG [Brevibacillus brevis]